MLLLSPARALSLTRYVAASICAPFASAASNAVAAGLTNAAEQQQQTHFDLVVIGGGSGGLACAQQAAGAHPHTPSSFTSSVTTTTTSSSFTSSSFSSSNACSFTSSPSLAHFCLPPTAYPSPALGQRVACLDFVSPSPMVIPRPPPFPPPLPSSSSRPSQQTFRTMFSLFLRTDSISHVVILLLGLNLGSRWHMRQCIPPPPPCPPS
jgi:hypothetical protein